MDFTGIEKAVYGNRNLEEDEELLAELLALEAEETRTNAASQRVPPVPPRTSSNHPGRSGGVDPALLATALADPADSVNVQEDDPELLRELSDLVGDNKTSAGNCPNISHNETIVNTSTAKTSEKAAPSVVKQPNNDKAKYLHSLLDVYQKMQVASEKDNNVSKARRLQRLTDKLRSLIAKAEKGLAIDESEIPPAPPGWQPSDSTSHTHQQDSGTVTSNDVNTVGSSSRNDKAMPAVNPPTVPHRSAPVMQKSATENTTNGAEAVKAILIRRRNAFVANGKAAVSAQDKEAAQGFVRVAKMFDEAIAAVSTASPEELNLDDIPRTPPPYRKAEVPKTFLEGLQMRMKIYQEMAHSAKQSGNERKARMNGRMVAQYEEAIRNVRNGIPVNEADLPSLPNMPPLPAPTKGPSQKTTGPPSGIRPPPSVGPLAPSESSDTSRNANQLQFLLQRQQQFKQAAIQAKSAGNVELARKYLIDSKGFDKMINASRAGLPVSIKDTPIPPQAATKSTTLKPRIVASSTSVTGVEGRGEVLSMLEKTLIEQIQLADNNRMRFTRLGDVGKVKLFESWAKSSKQDLLLVREVAKQGLRLPRFHYENRHIPTADLFPDLAEDVIELSIKSAKDVPLPSGYEPSHANLFVRYSFPYPDPPQAGKTKYVSGTTCPEFDEVMMLQIGSRKSRGQKLCRVLRRTALKLEVYQKGGFLRSDKLLGTCEWKLDGLESSAELEESLPLKDGRKAVGGLLTLRIRVREPLGDSKMHVTSQKWIILDN